MNTKNLNLKEVNLQNFAESGFNANALVARWGIYKMISHYIGSPVQETPIPLGISGYPAVAFTDEANSNKLTVMKYDGTEWITVGGAGVSPGGVSNPSMQLDVLGNPIVAFTDVLNGNKLTVMKYDGTEWITVGGVGVSPGTASNPSIQLDISGNPVVAFSDGAKSFKLTVMKYENSTWSNVGGAGVNIGIVQDLSMQLDSSNNPVIAYLKYTNGSTRVSAIKYDGSGWVSVGTDGFGGGNVSGRPSIQLDISGNPVVAFSDGANSSKLTVMKYENSTWSNVGTAGVSPGGAGHPSMQLDASDNPIVAFTDYASNDGSNKLTVMKYDGITWGTIGGAEFSDSSASRPSLQLDSLGDPIVSFRDGSNGKITVMNYDEYLDTVSPTDPTISVAEDLMSITMSGSTDLDNEGNPRAFDYFYSLDGLQYTKGSVIYSYNFPAEGSYTLYAKAVDFGGNESGVVTLNVILFRDNGLVKIVEEYVDTTPPTLPTISITENATSVILSGSTDMDDAENLRHFNYFYSLDGLQYTKGSVISPGILGGEGQFTVYAKAIDLLNNESAISTLNVEVYFDGTITLGPVDPIIGYYDDGNIVYIDPTPSHGFVYVTHSEGIVIDTEYVTTEVITNTITKVSSTEPYIYFNYTGGTIPESGIYERWDDGLRIRYNLVTLSKLASNLELPYEWVINPSNRKVVTSPNNYTSILLVGMSLIFNSSLGQQAKRTIVSITPGSTIIELDEELPEGFDDNDFEIYGDFELETPSSGSGLIHLSQVSQGKSLLTDVADLKAISAVNEVLTVTENGQEIFTLTHLPIDNYEVEMFVNGLRYLEDEAFTRIDKAITWTFRADATPNAGFDLETADTVSFNYKIIQQ